jgi:hypothetical protein
MNVFGKMQKKDPVGLLAVMSAFYKLRTRCHVMNVFFIEKAKKGMVQLFAVTHAFINLFTS